MLLDSSQRGTSTRQQKSFHPDLRLGRLKKMQ
jgi:hypothetical protein